MATLPTAINAVIGFASAPYSRYRPANPNTDPCLDVLLSNIAQSRIRA